MRTLFTGLFMVLFTVYQAQSFVKRSSAFGLQGNCFSVSFADIDNDGDYDAFLSCGAGGVTYWENTGTKTAPVYSLTSFNYGFAAASDVGFADLDNDGDLDAIGVYGADPVRYVNTGTKSSAAFTQTFQLTGLGASSGIHVADIDNDGDFDAVAAYTSNKVFMNTGSKTNPLFSAGGSDLGFNESSSGVHVMDFDNDGVKDLMSIYSNGAKFWRNTGTNAAASFVKQSGNFGITDSGFGIHFVDIDNDGDQDAFIVYGTSAIGFWENTTPVALKELTQNKIEIHYKNGNLELTGKLPVGPVEMVISDVIGRELSRVSDLSGNEILLPSGVSGNGLYFYRLMNGTECLGSGKFVICR